jgi:hypothetical protein
MLGWTGTAWVNVGPLSTARLSTLAGNVLTMEPSTGALKHFDADHITLANRDEVIASEAVLQDDINTRLPLSGGTLTGPLVAPLTTWQDPEGVVTTREFVAANFVRSSQNEISSPLGRFTSLEVTNVVSDLKVGPTTDLEGALSRGQATDLFSSITHVHPQYAMSSEVMYGDRPTTVTNTMTFSGAGAIRSGSMGMFADLRLSPVLGNSLDPERMFYYNSSTGRWVFTSPAGGSSMVEVQQPILQSVAPTSPSHTANKQYVDDHTEQVFASLPMTILDNSTLTGTPTCGTAPVGNDSSIVANTAFVQREAKAMLKAVVAASTSWSDFQTKVAAL